MVVKANALGEKFLAWMQSAEGQAGLAEAQARTKKAIQHLREAHAKKIVPEKWRNIRIRAAA